MKKWLCGILLLVLVAACAFALAEDVPPTLAFVETERVNYKPILTGNRKELAVDTWLQQLLVENEDYFWEADPAGPVFDITQTGGPTVETYIDEERVLRLDTFLKKECKITFSLKVAWAGQTAETHMYINFYKCAMPKSIGFEDEYTLYTGETLRLEVNYDNGKWPYRIWRGLNPQSYDKTDWNLVDAWAEPLPGGSGAATLIRGLQPGKTVVRVEANQDGLNWYKNIVIKIVDYTDKQGNKYFLNYDKTAVLVKGAKNAAKATVPDTVKIGKKKYKVTEIGPKAFSGNKKLVSVTIGKNVARIGDKAFYNCKKLSSITIKTKKLTAGSIGKSAFKNIVKKATFKCPSKKLAKVYKPLLVSAGAGKKITCK